MRYQGSGSSLLNPYHFLSHEEAFENRNINYEFEFKEEKNYFRNIFNSSNNV